MPRVTAPGEICELKINDAVSGETITFYYEAPTPQEQVIYNKSLIRRKGNKIENTAPETNQKWGRKILRGFEYGNFAKRVDGKEVLYASDSVHPNYDPNWKELVCTYAMDLVMFLAMTVFGGNSRDIDIFGENNETEEIKEDAGKN